MTSSLANTAHGIADFDLWAIQVVVREGKPMVNLTRREKILASHLMRKKGVDAATAAMRLGVKTSLVHKYWKMPEPIPLDEIPDYVVGATIIKALITRKDVRLMTGC